MATAVAVGVAAWDAEEEGGIVVSIEGEKYSLAL